MIRKCLGKSLKWLGPNNLMHIPNSYKTGGEVTALSEMTNPAKGAIGPVAALGLSSPMLRTYAKLTPKERRDWQQYPGNDRLLQIYLDEQFRIWRAALAKRKKAIHADATTEALPPAS